jgi:hypothetical protein
MNIPLKILICWPKGYTRGHELAKRFEKTYGFGKPKKLLPDIHIDKLEFSSTAIGIAQAIIANSPADKTLVVLLASSESSRIEIIALHEWIEQSLKSLNKDSVEYQVIA